MAFRVRQDRLPYQTSVQTEEGLYNASQLLTQLTREPVQANKAIVGRNAFAHEAGIHQDGVLKDPRTYEIMRPQDVGQPTAAAGLGAPFGAARRPEPVKRWDSTSLSSSSDHVYHAVIDFSDHRRAIGDGDLRRIVDRLQRLGDHAPEPTDIRDARSTDTECN